MPSSPHSPKTGLARLGPALRNSCHGLGAAWQEAAFRQELLLAAVLIPLAFWVGQGWLETAVLIALPVLVLLVEILNSAIEAVVDRIGPEWHPLSKKAKDLGSAAVLLALALCLGIWAWALWIKWAACCSASA
ncbi:diacylglycerol kinase [Vandammella animalimorsus]|uniref:Diacylglycerol kinase n=1 Tax=Vandammella animalimorsus TaxID=2029117 RepID=A0A2A2AKM4_9BURK|nr:diacylglycerol kinase [Vandammella animalimorsus]PAT38262.1 diacylglycerol kinase [Vandammella animalimorsus]PAT40888.1 diacylglycerol kinase [Vandammella animalimorsus]